MINTLYKFLYSRETAPNAKGEDNERALQLATAALLMEVASADHHISDDERNTIRSIVEEKYSISADEAMAIAHRAEQDTKHNTSLYPFTRMINAELSLEERVEIVSMLWRVTAADGHIDAHEQHLVRKIADLLYVPHSQFIRTRLQHDGR
ncbi:MAG: TerB family tellurite resistance protein [Gammaproteobacteria bacterium]